MALDSDHDGLVIASDFIRFFNLSTHFNVLDKLIQLKCGSGSPSPRNTTSRQKKDISINYFEFNNWFGPSIHQFSQYYFRHDSKKNPESGR